MSERHVGRRKFKFEEAESKEKKLEEWDCNSSRCRSLAFLLYFYSSSLLAWYLCNPCFTLAATKRGFRKIVLRKESEQTSKFAFAVRPPSLDDTVLQARRNIEQSRRV